MRDPRLAELEFLTTLERDGPQILRVGKDAAEVYFGLAAGPMREMLVEFIEQGFVNGAATALDSPEDGFLGMGDAAFNARLADLEHVRLGADVTFRIGHKGRLRLWQLRDELRDDTRDVFGLFARRAWDRTLAVQLLVAGTDSPFAMMLGDIDRFKAVNDTHGHTVGDEVLRRVFEVTRNLTADRAYRWGGEEVGVLLPGTSLEQAVVLAEAIRKAVQSESYTGAVGKSFGVTISLGVTCFVGPAEPVAATTFVDDLLYEAKNGCPKNQPPTTGGRNKVVSRAFGTP
jgi:diguanylate cyclase (GGDEF)-like protein